MGNPVDALPLTDEILERMNSILADTLSLKMLAERDDRITSADREVLLRVTGRIEAQAAVVLKWLTDTPIEALRH
jgi:hypothetical protein